jgi:mono/diheme cytochrome c family protein
MKSRLAVIVVLSTIISGCTVSLVGDVTPPPDAIVANRVTLAPVPTPAGAPNLQAGAGIYTNRCEPCHGTLGLGDGEQASQLPFFPAAIGDPDLAHANSPENWFRVISVGRITRNMPPFESTLSARERWDVLAYVYSLNWSESMVSKGQELYEQNRDGVAELVGDGFPISVNATQLQSLDLPQDDLQALTAYIQTQALQINMESRGDTTAEPAPSDNTTILGTFTGEVIYGSDGDFPTDLAARLYGFDHTDQVIFEQAQVLGNGKFQFFNIPVKTGRIFFVQVNYQELSFFSEFLTVDTIEDSYKVDVPIYNVTSNTDELAVDQIQVIFDFPETGVMRVVESVTISNLGNLAVAPDEGAPVLHFFLPPEASQLEFQEGELGSRYVPEETGFGDTRAVMPGIESYSLLFAYELPYESGQQIDLPVEFPIGEVVILVPENGIELKDSRFRLQGSQEIDGANYFVFAAKGYFSGDFVHVSLTGAHPIGGNRPGFLNDDSILVGMVAITLAVGYAWIWLRNTDVSSYGRIKPTLDKIVLLDMQFERGKLSKNNYLKRRNTLKSKLRSELMGRER